MTEIVWWDTIEEVLNRDSKIDFATDQTYRYVRQGELFPVEMDEETLARAEYFQRIMNECSGNVEVLISPKH